MTQQGSSGIPGIDVAEAATRLSAADPHGALLVDVREDAELIEVRVPEPPRPHVGLHQRATELPKDRPLLIMCATGVRSAAVTGYLLRSGWTDVTNVDGGIVAWQRAGLPVERGR